MYVASHLGWPRIPTQSSCDKYSRPRHFSSKTISFLAPSESRRRYIFQREGVRGCILPFRIGSPIPSVGSTRVTTPFRVTQTFSVSSNVLHPLYNYLAGLQCTLRCTQGYKVRAFSSSHQGFRVTSLASGIGSCPEPGGGWECDPMPSPPVDSIGCLLVPNPGPGLQPKWGQCGGVYWTGPTACAGGCTCTEHNNVRPYPPCQVTSKAKDCSTTGNAYDRILSIITDESPKFFLT